MTAPDEHATLPAEVWELYREHGATAAGDCLRRWGEALVRSRPDEALRWVRANEDDAAVDNPELAAHLQWTSGMVHHLAGDLVGATVRLERAARSFNRLQRQELADRASLLLLDLYAERAQITPARRLAKRLAQRFAARNDPERAAVALANLGCAEDAADRVRRAMTLWRRAAPILATDGLRGLLVRANLANGEAMIGRLKEAADGHRIVVEEARRRGLDALALQAELNLAGTEFAAGAVDNALRGWHRVLAEATNADSSWIALVAAVELAEAEVELGAWRQARARVSEALPRLEHAGLELEASRVRRLLALVDVLSGRSDGWRRHLNGLIGGRGSIQRHLMLLDVAPFDSGCDADSIVRSARRVAAAGLVNRSLVGLGWAARRAADDGRRRLAGKLAHEVLSSRRSSPWARMLAHHARGRCGGADAGRSLAHAVRWADRLHGRLAAVADRSAFLAHGGEVYLDLVNHLLERGRARDRRRALALLNRFRSGWLVDELAQRSDRSSDPRIRRWQELRRRLSELLRRLEGPDELRIRRSGLRLSHTVAEIESELNEVETALSRSRPGVVMPPARYDVAERLSRRLPAGHLFVETFIDRSDLLIFTLQDGRLHAERRRGAAQELAAAAASARFHLDAHTWIDHRHAGQTRHAFDRTLRRLGELLLDGLPIADADDLWIAPHGLLYQLPWPAITAGDGRPLVDRCRFSLVPGAGPLAELLGREQPQPTSFALSGAPSEELPEVAAEIDRLQALLPHATVMEAATRQQFLDILGSFDVVHLAGHAVFLDGAPTASGLRLSDGYATVHDLAATTVTAQLVSFGVCSGVRLASTDDHRSEGFLRALLAGGVRSAVGATAPITDAVASTFDLSFHRELAANGFPAEAYRHAVRSLRGDHPHPATWGAFHFFGDMRAWSSR